MSFLTSARRKAAGRVDTCETDPSETDSPPSDVSPRVREARLDLLERISSFTMKHSLEVNGPNLASICNALSGSNAQLAEAFATREISREPIDQRWLDTLARLDPETNDRIAELETLMDQLEYSLIRFAQTARSAADETSDHRGALDQQLLELDKAKSAGEGGAEVSRVIDLSRTMLESIARVEESMERSQAETDSLRENLAKARMEADVDHLTRLPNRRAFERRLASAATQARANDEPLCVAFCDIDHFKAVNDTHGHEAGDRILCAVASTLNSLASDDCFVARHGGEEFVMLFHGLGKDEAFDKLDGVRRAMAVKQLMNRETGRPFGKVTFSGGLAEVGKEGDPRDALAVADTALYEAKETGRNRIIAN
ncbi:MAG: GGDEF domain-containing protein [Pseudomonadota bacterium]